MENAKTTKLRRLGKSRKCGYDMDVLEDAVTNAMNHVQAEMQDNGMQDLSREQSVRLKRYIADKLRADMVILTYHPSYADHCIMRAAIMAFCLVKEGRV